VRSFREKLRRRSPVSAWSVMAATLLASSVCIGARAADPATAADPASAADPNRTALVYLVRRSWHIDVGFAAADLAAPLAAVAAQFPGVRYVLFGFGDQQYLLAKKHNAPVLLGALRRGPGMILVTGLASPPQAAFSAPQVAALRLTEREERDVQAFVWGSLAKQPDPATLTPYANGPYEGSLYFSAIPQYSALHTCNTWAAEALAAAGLPVQSAGVVFAGQLWRQVRRLEKKQVAATQHAATAPAGGAAAQQGGLLPSWQTTVVVDP
jgi:Protein of unknown function (DUF2459)